MTLIEVVVATAILGLILVMSIGPTVTSYDTLRRARFVDVAEALAESEIDAARQLAFDEVGVSPNGAIASSRTVTVNGFDLTVATTVDWVGTAGAGVDAGFFASGHDGIEGLPDYGANYKWIEVSVSSPTSGTAPIVMSTAIAPERLSNGSLATGTVVVEMKAHEPIGSPTTDPLPSPTLIGPGGTVYPAPMSLGDGRFEFSGLPASATPYVVRLGSTLAAVESTGIRWRIHPSDIDSFTDRVEVGAGEIDIVSLTVYRPVELNIYSEGKLNAAASFTPLQLGSLIIGFEGRYAVQTEADMVTPGSWRVTEFNGNPLIPGTYSVQIDAPGYLPYIDHGTEVSSGYPTVLTENEAVQMVIATDNTVERTFTIRDANGTPLRGVVAEVSGSNYGPLVIASNEAGIVRVNLPAQVSPTINFHPPYGHLPLSHSPGAINVPGADDIVLPTPTGRVLVTLPNGDDAYFSYLAMGSGANWSVPVLPNSTGTASIALPTNGLSADWNIRKVCWGSENTVVDQTFTIPPFDTTLVIGGLPC